LSCLLYSTVRRGLPDPISFPYTTLFRSGLGHLPGWLAVHAARLSPVGRNNAGCIAVCRRRTGRGWRPATPALRVCGRGVGRSARSEEHTSELQSRENLVCRLLLVKNK